MAAATALAATACSDGEPEVVIEWGPATEIGGGAGYRSRPLQHSEFAGARFTEMAPSATGLGAFARISDRAMLANRTLSHGTGVALGDVDGDGWPDLYFARLGQPGVLYRNLGGWRFEDVTEAAGIHRPGRTERGAVFADADADGDPDLFLSVHGAPNALLLNDGAGRFAEAAAGFAGNWGTTSATLADTDSDGDLDVYFANYKTVQADDLFSPAERDPRRFAEEDGEGGLLVRPPWDAHYRVELNDGRVRRFELAEPDEYYLNDGSGQFTPAGPAGGPFYTADGRQLARSPRAWGLAAKFFDADDDGDPDLYVSNDFGSRDGFWINEGGVFHEAPDATLRTVSASSMGLDAADIDGDGDTDFLTADMLAADMNRRRRQVPAPTGSPPEGPLERDRAGRNALQMNRGDGTFAEIGRRAGVDASEWTWGVLFMDADLDGFPDLFVANGHAVDPLDGDTQDALRTGALRPRWQDELGAFPPLSVPNLAFRNLGDGRFEPAGAQWGFGTEPDVSHALAAADLDRDGDQDLVITRLNRPPLVLRNDAGGARVSVRVGGAPPAEPGTGTPPVVGARVTLRVPDLPPQTRQITAGGMYLSGSDQLVTFAMGAAEEASLEVVWPSGPRAEFPVETGRGYEVWPPASLSPPGVSARGTGLDVGAGSAAGSLFEPPVVAGRHRESSFDELTRQPLVPVAVSRAGPGVAWVDVDADGDDDLVTGAATGERLTVAVNDGDVVGAPVALGPVLTGDAAGFIPAPAAGSGYSLLAGVSNWEAPSPRAARKIDPLVWIPVTGRGNPAPSPLVGGPTGVVGPLASADIDGDGDLDLFAGAGSRPGEYPLPAGSRILLQEDGRWTVDDGATAVLAGIGPVSGAVFSDLDGDADPDLALAVDWGPVTVLLNEGGAFRDATRQLGLSGLRGRWNGVSAADFNGDGHMDLLVTGRGSNETVRPSPDAPAGVYAADLDGNGTVEILEFATERGDERLTVGYPELTAALPLVRRVAPSFAEFSRLAPVTLFDAAGVVPFRSTVTTLEHTVLINEGGTFRPRPLPAGAQLAPAHGAAVADFDRDGREDIFLAQNYFSQPEGRPRSDAGRGLVMKGRGDGWFDPVPAARSGAVVWGDGRGAAVSDFDRDGRWDLAVTQNDGETLLFEGAGPNPGLHVRLTGPPNNPLAVGAMIRVRYPTGLGPAREIQAGSGYLSSNGTGQVFAAVHEPRAVLVRWPDGTETEHTVQPGSRLIEVRAPGTAGRTQTEGTPE